MKKMSQRLPKGWDEAKVRRVLRHYEGQTSVQAAEEDEAAYAARTETLVSVPVKLLPEVRKLLARRKAG